MIIQDLITFILTTVFWCLGFRIITDEGNLLYFIRKWAEKAKPEWITKPFVTCITCIASAHGLLMFIILCSQWIIESNVFTLILGIIMASFIQTFIWDLYDSIITRSKYYKRLSEVN